MTKAIFLALAPPPFVQYLNDLLTPQYKGKYYKDCQHHCLPMSILIMELTLFEPLNSTTIKLFSTKSMAYPLLF